MYLLIFVKIGPANKKKVTVTLALTFDLLLYNQAIAHVRDYMCVKYGGPRYISNRDIKSRSP